MISEYVGEQKRYTQQELCEILHSTWEKSVPVVRKLKEYGVLKVVRKSDAQKDMTDLAEEDVEVLDSDTDEGDCYYVFTFVGIIVVAGRVLKCCPKYLLSSREPLKEMKQVLKVLSKYSRSREQAVNSFAGDSKDGKSSFLSLIIFLLSDYYEYGVYNNSENIIEVNGEGEILWGRTIDEKFPVIKNGRPYYMELCTRKSVNDETDYFHRLHQAVLADCSRQLEDAQLNELFDIEPVELTDETVDEFGEPDYILEKIDSEISVQFNTRKQTLLKALYAYISHNFRADENELGFSLYGTNSFNLLWENVCSSVFSNMLQVPLGRIPLPKPLADGYDPKTLLIDIIERPVWHASEDGQEYSHKAGHTLIPDLITVSGKQFCIFDAKYYNLYMEPDALRGQPGIESITKQYLYQLAYRDFAERHGFSEVRNCFLMPAEGHEIVDKGYVSLEMLHGLGLENIAVRLLPAEYIYDAYLSERHIDVSELKL